MRRTISRALLPLAGAATFVMLSAVPSSAALPEVITVKVGSNTQVAASTGWIDYANKQNVTRLIANFTSHTTNSVKMTSLKICYSGPSDILLRPVGVNNNGTQLWAGTIKQFSPSGCQTWTVSKTFSKQSNGSLVTMHVRGNSPVQRTTTGFYR